MRINGADSKRRSIAIAASLVLVAALMFVAAGCSGKESAKERFADRIATMVPWNITFEGHGYKSADATVATVKVTPDDLQYAGTAYFDTTTTDQSATVSDEGYWVFAIKGIDKRKAIAVRFSSANAVYYYYLRYDATD